MKQHDPGFDYPPDAGHSTLGAWGLTNPTVAWLLSLGDGEVLAETPKELTEGGHAPLCKAVVGLQLCGQRMVRRPGAWACYHHRDRPHGKVEVRDDVFERAPQGDVLRRTGEVLDYQRNPVTGEWEIKPVQLRRSR